MLQKTLFSKITKFIHVVGLSVVVYFFINIFSFYKLSDNDLDKKSTDDGYKISAIKLPTELYFANEKMPLEDISVKESLDRELLINVYWQSQTLLFIKRANRYFEIIEPILKETNIPDDFKYLAVIESGLMNSVSPSGAAGFWQFLTKTAQEYNLEINSEVDERYNLEKSTYAACQYFNESFKKFKNWTLVAASYNMGKSGLAKQLQKQLQKNYYNLHLNSETARYVYRIAAVKEIILNHEKYGFFLTKEDLYPNIKTTDMIVDSTIVSLADFACEKSINYKILKLHNPWLRETFLTNKQRKKYTLKIPVNGYYTDISCKQDTLK